MTYNPFNFIALFHILFLQYNLDFSQDLKYVHHDEFFKDGMHLNEKGADEFTKDLISKIVFS